MIRRVFSVLSAFTLLVVLTQVPAPEPASGAARKPDPRAWPAVYEPASIGIQELLAAAKRADGGAETRKTMRVTYAIQDGGLTGTYREVWRGEDYRADTTLGPFVTAEGKYQGQRWELGENGYVLLKQGIHQRAAANARALETPDASDDVGVLGRLRAPQDVYVMRLSPKLGRTERRFYDTATYQLVRRETMYLDALVVTTYADYRTVRGAAIPYRTTYSDGHPENDSVLSVSDVAVGEPVTDAEVAQPHPQRELVRFPNGADTVRLPARIDPWGYIIVRLTVNGRGLDFMLDSGCSDISIDREVARELGLTVHGRWSNTVAGTFTAGKAIIPKVQIGAMTMDDVTVSVLPFQQQNDERTKVVGLLGFDFIAGGIIKIDYERGEVYAMRYGVPLPKDALLVDAVLDDNVPMVPLTVNGARGDRFVLDTGADDVVLFTAFAKQHPAAISDHSPGRTVSRGFNLITSSGVGGELRTRAYAFERMDFASVRFTDFFSEVMAGEQPAFEGEDTDGIIGASVLSAFDVYLDYANSQIGLVLNASAKKHRPSRGLGSSR